jgi:glutathione S-transferase|tara:strand:+ start:985 stop:1641 length:657 start_codon:yes stop_codon:yes gene_type:complete
MNFPILYSFKRCPYAMRARMALKLANIKSEIREVRLNNKPKHMIEVSPKGTVPILILENEVIDESNDIINWVLDKNNIFKNKLDHNQKTLTENLIQTFDSKFKYHLDRYKYSSRYENVDIKLHRSECLKILVKLEKYISCGKDKWIFGNNINKLDICVLPFIRQFKIADPKWFNQREKIKKVRNVLNNFIDSNLFKQIMHGYRVWNEDDDPVYFPLDE